jgi:NAD(P)-dependent dehydrogenase (short-subunit alcohol dehydrogenase family)
MLMPAERRVAIVTGAAIGIGRAMTLGLLGDGIDVAAAELSRGAPGCFIAACRGGGEMQCADRLEKHRDNAD